MSESIHALRPWPPADPRPYADLRARFRHALSTLLPAAAHYPLQVLLEEIDDHIRGGPERDPREVDALQGVQAALLAYRATLQEVRGTGPTAHEDHALLCDAVAKLLRELPPDLVVWRSLDGEHLAGKLSEEVAGRTSLGRQYAADIIRVCRDLLGRDARRREDP